MKRIIFSLLILLAGAGTLALEIPYLSGHINDTAHMLSADTIAELEQLLTEYEKTSGNQIVLLTIASLDGEVLEDYSFRVAETWKLGREDVDNGALLLIAQSDRKLRIEVGYGLEPSLTDALTSHIIRNIITPQFKSGNFERGIRNGLEAMIEAADGTLAVDADELAGSGDAMEIVFFLVFWFSIVLLFTGMGMFTDGCMGWFLYAFLVPFYAAPMMILASMDLSIVGIVIFLLYLIGYPIAKLLLPKTDFGKKIVKKVGSSKSGRGGVWFGGSGWSSGGGFSGGGGSFGGGGSSGGW